MAFLGLEDGSVTCSSEQTDPVVMAFGVHRKLLLHNAKEKSMPYTRERIFPRGVDVSRPTPFADAVPVIGFATLPECLTTG
jgi:hypothetical protein